MIELPVDMDATGRKRAFLVGVALLLSLDLALGGNRRNHGKGKSTLHFIN